MLRQDDEAIVAHCTERGWPHPGTTPVQAPIASIRLARQNSVSENEKMGDHKPEPLKKPVVLTMKWKVVLPRA